MMRKRANQIATYGICWAARCLRMVVPIVAVALPAMCLGQSYIVTDLGKLGGNFATGIGINSSGQVVGESAYAFVPFASHVHAFLSNGGPVMDIGAIGGNNTFNSSAQDINDSGVIVGASEGVGFSEHAFVYANGVMQDLGTLGGGQSNARAINNAGQIVGYADLPSSGFLRHAFLYDNGVMHDLGTLGGPSVRLSAATDINSFG